MSGIQGPLGRAHTRRGWDGIGERGCADCLVLGQPGILRNEAVWGLGELGAEEVCFCDGRGGVHEGFEGAEGGVFGGLGELGMGGTGLGFRLVAEFLARLL